MYLCLPMGLGPKRSGVFVSAMSTLLAVVITLRCVDNNIDIFFKIADALALGSSKHHH